MKEPLELIGSFRASKERVERFAPVTDDSKRADALMQKARNAAMLARAIRVQKWLNEYPIGHGDHVTAKPDFVRDFEANVVPVHQTGQLIETLHHVLTRTE